MAPHRREARRRRLAGGQKVKINAAAFMATQKKGTWVGNGLCIPEARPVVHRDGKKAGDRVTQSKNVRRQDAAIQRKKENRNGLVQYGTAHIRASLRSRRCN
mmetsp:Transcript_24149/g.45969  ORF Transcript_24149/g.45969 Transcript_24149/m.45969 type:complete len:102 (-) Transcript_24149:1839-2144(-)|eukprot:scaffold1168_cov167-Amphora_coffeaeformis.AAC.2